MNFYSTGGTPDGRARKEDSAEPGVFWGPGIEDPYNFYLELHFLHHFTPSPDMLSTALYIIL